MKKHDADPAGSLYLDGMKRLMAISKKNWAPDGDGASGTEVPSERPSKHVCLVCGNMWDADRGKREGPKKCPSCSSTLWNNTDMKRHKCKRCSHVWKSRLDAPLVCPHCKSKLWNRDMERVVCGSCRHAWTCRSDKGVPRKCPSCSSCDVMPEMVECLCVRCGYGGKMKRNGAGICPICRAALSLYGGASEKRGGAGRRGGRGKASAGVDAAALDILMSDISDTRKIIELEGKAGIGAAEAEILVRFKKGEDPVSIARATDISLNMVLMTTAPLDSGEEFSR
ncbi:MAG: hypothetical protein FWH47_01930 [Methanomassiliicoccaceae archaeon]|nr:hypothetical protein [Methanomassiliicoccaceae archaeon]